MPDSALSIVDALITHGSAAAVAVAEEIRRKLRSLTRRHLLPGETIRLTRAILARYEPLLARTLSDTLLAAWIEGANEVGQDLPLRPESGVQPAVVGQPLEYVPHPKATPDEVMVWVDPQKLDASWKGDESYYLPPEGVGVGVSEIRGRREGFRRFMEKGEAIQAPRASLGEGGRVEIDDGRHRFAVLRDSGANVVPIMVPRKEAQEFRRRFGAGLPILPPPDVPEAPIASASSGEPLITFPATEAAARDLLERRVMTRAEFDVLADDAKRAAFTVARVSSLDALEKIRDAVASSVSEGSTLRDFRAKVDEALGASALAPSHVENVFRTNVASAYTSGLMDVLRDDLVSDEFPFIETVPILDSRLTDMCRIVSESGLDNSGVFLIDDPEWQRLQPPRHWSCRCGIIPLSVEDAAAKGIAYAKRWLELGRRPPESGFVNRVPVELPKGWVRNKIGALI